MSEVLIPFINALLILDNDGNRLFVKYYYERTKQQQLEFEHVLHKKTKNIQAKNEAEVLLHENEVVIFKSGADVRFYIVGNNEENELILSSMLETVYDALNTLLKGQVDKRTMLENLELILLTIDESIDHGYLMENDGVLIANRVLMRGSSNNNYESAGGSSHGGSSSAHASGQGTSLGDLTLSQAFGLARDQFFKGWTSSSGVSAPPIFPTYKANISNAHKDSRNISPLAIGFCMVLLPIIIFSIFFVSIYYGVQIIQDHIVMESSLANGIPNTRNIIRKWSVNHLHGIDITQLDNAPPIVKYNITSKNNTTQSRFSKNWITLGKNLRGGDVKVFDSTNISTISSLDNMDRTLNNYISAKDFRDKVI